MWSKEQLGWISCTEITSAGEYTLAPAESTPECYRITLLDVTDWEEYILLENRQQQGFDVNHFSPGIVMYHVDDWAADQAFTGYPGQDGWPENGNHYRVAVIQADGKYDLEKGGNIGDAGDIWKPGMTLTPNDDGNTYPNTDSYQEGFIENTGITIEILEQTGVNMKFRVSYSDRSDESSTLLSAPVKESESAGEVGEQDRPSFSTQRPTVPPEPSLDRTGKGEDEGISGKIPQLPWYDEWKEKQVEAELVDQQEQEQVEQDQEAGGEEAMPGVNSNSNNNNMDILSSGDGDGPLLLGRSIAFSFTSSLFVPGSLLLGSLLAVFLCNL